MSQAKLRQPAGHSADQRICSYLFLFLFLLLFNRRSVRATCWRDAAAIASNSSSKGPQKARPSQHRGGLLLPVQRPDGRLLYFAGLHGSWRLGPERQRDVHDHHDNSEFANRADAPPDAVILEDEAIDDRLYLRSSVSSLMDLLRPARDGLLVGTLVSARANSVKNDEETVYDKS